MLEFSPLSPDPSCCTSCAPPILQSWKAFAMARQRDLFGREMKKRDFLQCKNYFNNCTETIPRTPWSKDTVTFYSSVRCSYIPLHGDPSHAIPSCPSTYKWINSTTVLHPSEDGLLMYTKMLGRCWSYKGLKRCCDIVFRNHFPLETEVTSRNFIAMHLCTWYLVPNTLYLVLGSRCQIHKYDVHTTNQGTWCSVPGTQHQTTVVHLCCTNSNCKTLPFHLPEADQDGLM